MIQLNLKYKGSRNYLQGGDIYNAIVHELTLRLGGHLARLAFKSFARKQVDLLLENPSDAFNPMGSGIWKSGSGELYRFWLVETDRSVTESYPFEEEAITRDAEVSGEAICSRCANSYSLIENIIALTKRLNYALVPHVDGKWLFGQLDLISGLPCRWSKLCIERKQCVGSSFSRNRITIDDADYGEIRFIGGQP